MKFLFQAINIRKRVAKHANHMFAGDKHQRVDKITQ